MPSRLCSEPRCPNPATYRGRCATHSAMRERTRTKRGREVYGKERWKQLRRRKLLATPLCERCYRVASDVHHKHGVEADPWAIEGLESLCHSCHSQETRRYQLRKEKHGDRDTATRAA